MTQMSDADGLRVIQETAVKAAGGDNRIVKLPGEPPGVYGVLTEDGSIEKRFATRKPRQHRLLSISEVAGAIEHYSSIVEGANTPIVWYSPEMVKVVINDASTLPLVDCLFVPLTQFHTDQWTRICGLHENQFGQKSFINLLRHELWDCIGESGAALVKQVRALDWSRSDHTRSQMEKGRASYGKDIEAEVRSQHGGDLPDDLTLSVRIYSDPALQVRRSIRCAIEADPVSQTFTLIPYAGEIERALDDEMTTISGILEADLECPILYGEAAD